MAIVHRVVLLLAFLVAMTAPGAAMASFAPTPGVIEYFDGNPGGGAWFTSLAGACSSRAAYATSTDNNYQYTRNVRNGTCFLDFTGKPGSGYESVNGSAQYNAATRQGADTCPADATLSNGACTCNAGTTQSGSSCVSNQVIESSAAKAYADSLNDTGDTLCTTKHQVAGVDTCVNGFKVQGSTFSIMPTKNTDGTQVQCIGGPFSVGGPCTVSDDMAKSTNEPSCPAPGQKGTVNGVTVCIPPISQTSAPTSISGTNTVQGTPSVSLTPGGASGAPGGTGAGTSSQGGSTTCAGNSCTTTTTITQTKPDGSTASQTVTKASDKTTFCVENPKSPLCVTSSYTKGSCGTTPSCSGDAIQCAIAKEQFLRNCQFYTADQADSDKVTAARALDGKVNRGAAQEVDVAGGFSQDNALGVGAGCMQDRQFNLSYGGYQQNVTMPLSQFCGMLTMLGYLNVAVSLLVGFVIVGKG